MCFRIGEFTWSSCCYFSFFGFPLAPQGTTPGRPSFPERTEHERQTSVRGTGRTLLLTFAASTTSAYSNSCVSQGHKPLTSATLSVSLTTWPHWPCSTAPNKKLQGEMTQVMANSYLWKKYDKRVLITELFIVLYWTRKGRHHRIQSLITSQNVQSVRTTPFCFPVISAFFV